MSKLHLATITTMLQNSNCTLSDLAAEFNVTLTEMVEFFVDNKLKVPSATNGAGDFSHKFLSSTMPETEITNSKHVMLDYFNGLPLGFSPANINPINIIVEYHGRDPLSGLQCPFCGRYEKDITQAVNDNEMLFNFVDNDSNNFLVTNIEPCCRECMLERFDNMPLANETFVYKVDGNVPSRLKSAQEIELTIIHRPDLKTGYVCNKFYLDELVTKWVMGPLNTGKAMMEGIPYTPVMVAIWIYRQLTELGLLKGLVNVKVVDENRSAEINGAYMLMHYVLILQGMIQQQKASSNSNLIAPGTPENLGKAKGLAKFQK